MFPGLRDHTLRHLKVFSLGTEVKLYVSLGAGSSDQRRHDSQEGPWAAVATRQLEKKKLEKHSDEQTLTKY